MRLHKRFLTLHGHRTSLALEPEFWEALEEIARDRALSLAATVTQIDDNHTSDAVLTSAVRLAVLAHYRETRH
ncbi:ribbon-helix-helix domain-containing protein [Breoghania sp.]|uniref:ribbon-helix-helix domain-containing protein n=1 Tax=Breoghania sp. TaxID=2065378 RepID=UPI00262D8ACC|nr:ribbon-helix-helix domain-containing protein [Breoghania sp.]MDJ0931183.1 ribbon-helix-helix domain-containing protein [Breoghania sp.]